MSDSRPPVVPSKSTVGILLALLVTGALFVPTTLGYISYDTIQTADIEVERTGLVENGSTMIVEVSFHNPTDVKATVQSGYTEIRVNGTLVSQPASTFLDNTTIPPGETRTVRLRVWLDEDRTDLARQGVDRGTVRVVGELDVSVRGEQIRLTYGREGR